MRVYCFFAECGPAGFPARQEEVVQLWTQRWADAGFLPRVLTLDDAARHPRFWDIASMAFRMPTVNAPVFDWLCFVRWAAVAGEASDKHPSIFTDYDVVPVTINHGQESIAKAVEQSVRGRSLVNFDPCFGPGMIAGNKAGFNGLLDRILTYEIRGDEKTFDNPHVSDMTVIHRHCRELFVGSQFKCVLYDRVEGSWKHEAFVHFGNRYLESGIPKALQMSRALEGKL